MRSSVLVPKAGLALAATLLTTTALAAPADAADTWPAPFTYCPIGVVTNPGTGATTTTCIAAVGTGGEFKLGKTVVTLKPGTTLQGGLGSTPDGPSFIPANDGKTLTGPDQQVPGGVLGVAALQGLIPGITDIAAQVEVVGDVGFELGADIRITLPVRVHLKNALLGGNCAIGSAKDPIVLHLTTGTTTPPEGVDPISGTPGAITDPDLGVNVLAFDGQTVVDNTFAVPGATGCGPLGILNGVVDSRSGLPAAPGVSSAKLVNRSYIAAAADVPNISGEP